MDFNLYQMKALQYAIYKSPMYPAVGLVAEAGEFASKLSKVMRKVYAPNPWSALTPDQRDALVDELGDVLWMVAACATHLNSSLDELAYANLKKLSDRAARGVIDGSGDKR
jgi:NTP pyrophosphatase (non-canonical NTP hydrolase)